MDDAFLLDDEDLINNPTSRIAITLVLDTSVSMGPRAIYPKWVIDELVAKHQYADRGLLSIPPEYGKYAQPDPNWTPPIDELNRGLAAFFKAIHDDEIARWAADVAIITFGGHVNRVRDFASVDEITPPTLVSAGDTPMGAAVTCALDLLEQRKKAYSKAGVDYFQPWLVLMTDGSPTDSIDAAAARTRDLASARKLMILPVGIGQAADMTALATFSPSQRAVKLHGLHFSKFFAWMSSSAARTSRLFPGEDDPLDFEGMKDWGSL